MATLARLARLCFWGYALMLVGIGLTGMLAAQWELPAVFAVNLDTMDTLQRATLLNQYRFLKGIELAFGMFCIAYRREIFSQRRDLQVFLAGLSAGVAGRLGSWIVDGTPKTIFLVFMALELLTGVLVWWVVRRRNIG
jgi:hypothetical protein